VNKSFFDTDTPLAERMRPTNMGDFLGQEHLAGKDGAIMRFLKSGVLPSMIFWGPPGVGKTTLGKIIAREFGREFFLLNAVNSGVKEVRELITRSEKTLFTSQGRKPIGSVRINKILFWLR
jgi:putative ATPase